VSITAGDPTRVATIYWDPPGELFNPTIQGGSSFPVNGRVFSVNSPNGVSIIGVPEPGMIGAAPPLQSPHSCADHATAFERLHGGNCQP
jgi:hypothetical protein